MIGSASQTERMSRITRSSSFQDTGRFLVQAQGRHGTEVLTINRDSGISQKIRWYNNSKKQDTLFFTGISALNRGVLKRRQNKSTIHFNRESTNTELLFQTMHSATQLRIYGAATTWCSQFGLKAEEKGPNAVPMNSKVLIVVEPEEVEWFTANSSTWIQGAGTHSFRVLENRVQMTQLCEKASFQYLVYDVKYYQIQLDGKDEGEKSHTSFKESEVRLAVFAGTMIGPVSEVHIVATLGEYCIEVVVLFNSKSTRHIFRCDIPKDWTLRERASSTPKESSGPVMNCSKKSLKKKGCALRREKSNYELQVNLGNSELLETRCRPYHSYSESGSPVYEVSHSSEWEKVDNDSCKLSS